MYYDPMIAKLCSWGKDRAAAINAMADALDDFEVEGISHNLPFLSAVMEQDRFKSGDLTTAYIAEEFPEGFKGIEPAAADMKELAAVATFIHMAREVRAGQISGAMEHHRRVIGESWTVAIGNVQLSTAVERDGETLRVSVGGDKALAVTSDWQAGATHGRFRIGAREISVKISLQGSAIRLRRRGIEVIARVRSPRVAELSQHMPVKLAKDTSKTLLCPMPGMVKQIFVTSGDAVEAGQPLAVVEAMKMENLLRAERKTTVKRLAAKVGDSLAVDQLIMEFE
jgi:propionyl-CoA carboxylase alpha chain